MAQLAELDSSLTAQLAELDSSLTAQLAEFHPTNVRNNARNKQCGMQQLAS